MKAWFSIISFLLLTTTLSVRGNDFHPEFSLLNTAGEIWQDGEAISQPLTCGQCHNAEFIHSSLAPYHHKAAEGGDRLKLYLGITLTNTRKKNIQCLDCHNPDRSHTLSELVNHEGEISPQTLTLTSPTSTACGNCHSLVEIGSEALSIDGQIENDNTFGLTGEIFSSQFISQSALNIANKQKLNYSFDAHAERVVSCSDCHASANNPVSPQKLDTNKQLSFDPRTLSAHDYLQQPDHNFTHAHECSSCHKVDKTHNWLPYLSRHLSKLSCESCHSNWIASPAFSNISLTGDNIKVTWRGLQDGLITGYNPWLLPNKHGKFSPFNIIEIVNEKNTFAVAKGIHHNISSEAAIKHCSACHSNTSILLRALPANPRNLNFPESFLSNLKPVPAAAGIYVLGGDTVPIVDWLGLIILIATLSSVSAHGFALYLTRRKSADRATPRIRVYMYRYYQRLWHWLQAAIIFILLITGAAIHKPWLFSWLSFGSMVELHNIFAFILFTNAALALFYHLASGEIKQFIPMPADLFVRSFEQLHFYLKGIFENAPHPFEKDPQHKLNPLQKIAYFGLLNVLLPAQMFTGLLMWGAQKWPIVSDSIGGLTLLGPLHSLLAWAFVSFLIMHIYLTTTSGPRPLSGIQSMINGWEEVEDINGSTPNE
ncbi:cytochrome b/b6 domain-containing protein [Teredinibacter haidensis]|uniref:cytochrome b/b6 domain-containing protein n=1 Tax=Teredinibacter haidensis TaxID=2731755 RepID=UPI0009F9469F|nr:cytochrome b/b6 domain-containing protein [Teredinibacter haidensis]